MFRFYYSSRMIINGVVVSTAVFAVIIIALIVSVTKNSVLAGFSLPIEILSQTPLHRETRISVISEKKVVAESTKSSELAIIPEASGERNPPTKTHAVPPLVLSETTNSAKQTAGSTIHIDAAHAYLGRLFNLYQVMRSLNGATIAPGQTLSYDQSIGLGTALSTYMTGRGYNSSGVLVPMLAGGVCGGASALAAEVDRVGDGLVRRDSGARHLPGDHTAGGIYWNLPNVAVYYDGSRFYDLWLTNDNPTTTYKLEVSTNYDNIWPAIGIDLRNWQVSAARWSETIDPIQYTSTGEFQVTFTLIPQ